MVDADIAYLTPSAVYKGNPEALLAERDRKLREAAAKRKEVNKYTDDSTKINAGSNILA